MNNLEIMRMLTKDVQKIPMDISDYIGRIDGLVVYRKDNIYGESGWYVYLNQKEALDLSKAPVCLQNVILATINAGYEMLCIDSAKNTPDGREDNVLTLSTAHISKPVARYLDMGLVSYMKSEYGWFLYVDRLLEEDRRWNHLRIPAELINVLEFAHKMRCSVLCLDRDGEIVDELPFYEW